MLSVSFGAHCNRKDTVSSYLCRVTFTAGFAARCLSIVTDNERSHTKYQAISTWYDTCFHNSINVQNVRSKIRSMGYGRIERHSCHQYKVEGSLY